MAGVLVLNATFEPLAVVSTRRAVCLVLSDKVETLQQVHDGNLPFDPRFGCPEPAGTLPV